MTLAPGGQVELDYNCISLRIVIVQYEYPIFTMELDAKFLVLVTVYTVIPVYLVYDRLESYNSSIQAATDFHHCAKHAQISVMRYAKIHEGIPNILIYSSTHCNGHTARYSEPWLSSIKCLRGGGDILATQLIVRPCTTVDR